MSLLVAVGVGLVGGLGSLARFALDGSIAGRLGREFPYGTLVVNLTGAFALGIVVGLTLDRNAYRLIGTGLIGGFTTFSTWALESHRLGEDDELSLGILNFGIGLILGVVVAWAGRRLGGSM